MKKRLNHMEFHKIGKATLAMVLAGTFIFSATSTFADGLDQMVNNQPVNVQASSTADMKTTEQTTEKKEAPTLVPGNLFYFAKITLEKIKLALTFDDVKEAQLLASNASERLAEAEALFASGDQKTALATIKDALKAMENADNLVQEQQGAEQPADDSQATHDQATADNQVSEEHKAKNMVEDDTDIKEVKTVLSKNIIALTAAMEKVKNPVAKAALQKNIDKSYVKLAKKLEKLEKHQTKKQSEVNEGSTIIDEETTTPRAINTDILKDQAANTTPPSISEKLVQQASEVKQINQRAAQQEVRKTQQVAKQEVKVERQSTKQEVKQNQEAAKAFVKEKKEEVKQKQQGSNKEQTGNAGNQ